MRREGGWRVGRKVGGEGEEVGGKGEEVRGEGEEVGGEGEEVGGGGSGWREGIWEMHTAQDKPSSPTVL